MEAAVAEQAEGPRGRKVKAHVKVHHSIKGHTRYAGVFADPKLRGMIIGLWLLASERHASKTGNVVSLTGSDLQWITGAPNVGSAALLMRSLCQAMNYKLGREQTAGGTTYHIGIRKFAQKQGFPLRFMTDKSSYAYNFQAPSESDPDPDSDSEKNISPQTPLMPDPGHGESDLRSPSGEPGTDDPSEATVDRVLQLVTERLPWMQWVNGTGGENLIPDLRARIERHPRMVDFEYFADQANRQPFVRGVNRHKGPMTLAELVSTEDMFLRVCRRDFNRGASDG